MKRLIPIALMFIAWTNPPPECNMWDLQIKFICLEVPATNCTDIITTMPPYNAIDWQEPTLDTAWWWTLTARDILGNPVPPNCQPVDTKMDGWLVP
jgi:hypothetical protein